jgi:hypothetical protein
MKKFLFILNSCNSRLITIVNTRLNGRYAALLLSTALAGAASSVIHPVVAVRGALLGISLAIGLIIIDTLSQKDLSSNKRPARKTVLLSATIAGCFGGIVINLFSVVIGSMDEFKPLVTPGVATFALVLCYSFAMHTAYELRWKVETSKFLTIVYVALAGAFCGLIRAIIVFFVFPEDRLGAIVFTIIAPVSGIIFAVLWAIVVILCDPAWSFERWNSTVGSDNPG